MKELDKKKKELMHHLLNGGFLKTASIIMAFKEVPRQQFVLKGYEKYAYDDTPLPTINESTISQPSTVAAMLEYLEPKTGEKILEIGTGSGWQSCLLSRCVSDSGNVVTIEIDEAVAKFAIKNIKRMKIKNIKVVIGDGSVGYAPDAPYDKIIYTAAAPRISTEIISQLRLGGRIIAPVGNKFMQVLKIIDKVSENELSETEAGSFRFVPLKGKRGFD
ncbi:MAG: protein-L-isoaspartate(D-aspartate) O-methyltransferase [Candidatus Micrarchaeales archaeon]